MELEQRDQDHPDTANPLTLAGDKKAWYAKLSVNTPDPSIRFVPMTRADYSAYWAKDRADPHPREAAYLPHVSDPPGGRKAWVQQQLELDAAWREVMQAQDPAQQARKSPQAFAKYTAQQAAEVGFIGLTGPFGLGAIWAGDKIKQRRTRAKEAAAVAD